MKLGVCKTFTGSTTFEYFQASEVFQVGDTCTTYTTLRCARLEDGFGAGFMKVEIELQLPVHVADCLQHIYRKTLGFDISEFCRYVERMCLARWVL